jgi:hypothetical protein
MACTTNQPPRKFATVGRIEEHEQQRHADRLRQPVAIDPLQRGTCCHCGPVGLSRIVQPGRNPVEPGPTIVIVERMARTHLRDAVGGVERVAFEKVTPNVDLPLPLTPITTMA